MIIKIPRHIKVDKVDVWFQDEAKFGQQNTTTRLWAERGNQPRAIKNSRLNIFIYLILCAQQKELERS
ncbi:hypothetical protein C9J19_18850 [Photobacterium phosphoreum]|nr:hypothetical protein C9J19_18850 [Photobacterium phosphoreum]